MAYNLKLAEKCFSDVVDFMENTVKPTLTDKKKYWEMAVSLQTLYDCAVELSKTQKK